MIEEQRVNEIYIGIDPGVSGALAAIKINKGDGQHCYDVLSVLDMPKQMMKSKKNRVDAYGVRDWFDSVVNEQAPCKLFVCVEQVASRPGDGHSAAFNFGDSFGVLRGVLSGLALPYEFVSPVKWKRAFGLIGSDKDYSRTVASQLLGNDYLKRKKDHNRAEAMLLAIYGKNNMFK